MHELSIAMSIVEVAGEEIARRGWGIGRVRAVHLKLGLLSGVAAEALRFSWDMACAETALDGALLEIEHMPVKAWCAACGCEREIESVQRMACPMCGGPAGDIRGGRELEVTGLEVCDDADADSRSAPAGAEAQ